MGVRPLFPWLLLAFVSCSEDPSSEDCSAGEIECGGRCVDECSPEEDLDVDACVCEPRCRDGRVWNGRQCVEQTDGGLTCEVHEVACGDTCANLDVDPAHCGDCATACDPFFACEDAECVCAGTSEECGETDCGDGVCEEGETTEGCVDDCCEDGGYDCRLVGPQCGCAEGRGCLVDRSTRWMICGDAGDTAYYEECSGDGQCRPGAECSEVAIDSETAQRVCRPYCNSDDDCLGDGSRCVYTARDAKGDEILDARACSMDCNPITIQGCGPGFDCDVYLYDDAAYTECNPPGLGGDLDACDEQQDCGRGFTCVGGTCFAWCRMDQGCGGGLDCRRFVVDITFHGVEYGFCD